MKVTKYIEVGDHVPDCSLAREGFLLGYEGHISTIELFR